jgi:hypothetical protein
MADRDQFDALRLGLPVPQGFPGRRHAATIVDPPPLTRPGRLLDRNGHAQEGRRDRSGILSQADVLALE